jgi:drug/metabolite transporter (DMT)-like permease
MGIGLGVSLIVIGGILSFTHLDDTLLKTNLDAVGYVLMLGGLLALVFGTIQNRQRANTSHTAIVERRLDEPPVPPVQRDDRPLPDERREP